MHNRYLFMNERGYQSTLAVATAVEGFGYWTGRDVRVEFRPAEPDTGIVFVRIDLPGRPRIPALVENRVDTPLRTSLRVGDACIDMVEHIMAALGGLEIDNCQVWVDRPEMPGCDGSALPFTEAIDAAGRMRQDAPRRGIEVKSVCCACDKHARIEARPLNARSNEARSNEARSNEARSNEARSNEARSNEAGPNNTGSLEIEYHLDYPETAIGRQHLKLTLTPESFRRELAPSRTFLLEEEARRLRAQGLGERASFADLLVFGENGPIDNELRFEDECVRHKLLDMVGDLTLAGAVPVGSFSAWRSGHHLNARMVRTLLNKENTFSEYRRCA